MVKKPTLELDENIMKKKKKIMLLFLERCSLEYILGTNENINFRVTKNI